MTCHGLDFLVVAWSPPLLWLDLLVALRGHSFDCLVSDTLSGRGGYTGAIQGLQVDAFVRSLGCCERNLHPIMANKRLV